MSVRHQRVISVILCVSTMILILSASELRAQAVDGDVQLLLSQKDIAERECETLMEEKQRLNDRLDTLTAKAEILGDSRSIGEMENLTRKLSSLDRNLAQIRKRIKTLDQRILQKSNQAATESSAAKSTGAPGKNTRVIVIDDSNVKDNEKAAGHPDSGGTSWQDHSREAQRQREWDAKMQARERERQLQDTIREDRDRNR